MLKKVLLPNRILHFKADVKLLNNQQGRKGYIKFYKNNYIKNHKQFFTTKLYFVKNDKKYLCNLHYFLDVKLLISTKITYL